MFPFIISLYSNSLMHAYRYVAVGNEPFLMSYNGHFQAFVLSTMLNIQEALGKANLATQIKVVVPCNANVYHSKMPSKGTFRLDVNKTMQQLVSFLNKNGSPFVVNVMEKTSCGLGYHNR